MVVTLAYCLTNYAGIIVLTLAALLDSEKPGFRIDPTFADSVDRGFSYVMAPFVCEGIQEVEVYVVDRGNDRMEGLPQRGMKKPRVVAT